MDFTFAQPGTSKPVTKRSPRPSSVVQLLALIAYLEHCGSDGASVSDLAATFQVSEEQIIADIELLWCTGTPGYGPNDLIDFDADAFERRHIRLVDSRGAGLRLTLTATEQATVAVTLHLLVDSLSAAMGEDVTKMLRALAEKLQGAAQENLAALNLRLIQNIDEEIAAKIRQSLDDDRQVEVEYVSALGTRTVRTLNPVRLDLEEPHLYVLASTVDEPTDYKFYRLDRIINATVLAAERNAPADGRYVDRRLVDTGTSGESRAVIIMREQARWIVEKLPHTAITENDDGTLRAELTVVDDRWFLSLLMGVGELLIDAEPSSQLQAAAEHSARTLELYATTEKVQL